MAANPILSILVGFLAAPSIIQGFTSSFPPFASGMARKGYRERPNLIPPPGELVSQTVKGIIGEGEFESLMTSAGYSSEMSRRMLSNARSYLAALDYITVWRRGEFSEGQLNQALRDQGIVEEDIDVLKKATLYFPTPQDLIRFSVREVFTPETRAKYGLDEDYPTELDANAEKAGIPPEVAHWYWQAHWELPSPTQVYEMLHRGFIKEADVELYLKSADYMPYWRKHLIAMSYDNYTRVDIRRMYAMGVLSEMEVKRAYMDIGYNEEKADKLTQWTVLEARHSPDSTPTSTTMAAYKSGAIDRAQAGSQLTSAGVDFATVTQMLDTADASLRQELIDLEADSIIDAFQKGTITIDDVRTQLTRIGVPSRMLALTVERELAQWRRRQKTATKGDLDSWWRMGVVGDTIYRKKMEGLGYGTLDINRFLAELRVGDLTGADKKFPFADALRAYSNGEVSESSAISTALALGMKEDQAAELLEIVRLANP